MVQFNLLPDIKVKYIKARHQKKMVIFWASTVTIVSFGLLILSALYVFGVQGAQIAHLNNQIKKSQDSITNKNRQVDDINKVLTVQNQLSSLDTLHQSKPRISRLFGYLSKVVPSQVTISNISISHEDSNVISIQGSTDSLQTVNRFVDTIKFSSYKSNDEGTEPVLVFTEVILASFGRSREGASYTINFKYNPILFAEDENIDNLIVPSKITTRSEIGRPIFQTDVEKELNAPLPSEETN